jgi:hypothetical protein
VPITNKNEHMSLALAQQLLLSCHGCCCCLQGPNKQQGAATAANKQQQQQQQQVVVDQEAWKQLAQLLSKKVDRINHVQVS